MAEWHTAPWIRPKRNIGKDLRLQTSVPLATPRSGTLARRHRVVGQTAAFVRFGCQTRISPLPGTDVSPVCRRYAPACG